MTDQDTQLKQHRENQQKLNTLIQSVEGLKLRMDKMEDKIIPMAETYDSASRLGRWGAAALTFAAIILGIVISIKELLKK